MSFPLENVYPHIVPAVKGVGPAMLDLFIVNAADKLLRRVALWNAQLDPIIPVVDVTDPQNPIGQTDYVLIPPTDAQVVKVNGWSIGGVGQKMLTLPQAIARGLEPGGFTTNTYFDGPTDDAPAYAPAAWQVVEGTVRISPPPIDVTALMTFSVNLTVFNGATTLPDVLLPYVRLLGYDALASLQMVPGKDYSNPQAAAANAGLFEDGVGSLTIRLERAFGSATVRRRVRAY